MERWPTRLERLALRRTGLGRRNGTPMMSMKLASCQHHRHHEGFVHLFDDAGLLVFLHHRHHWGCIHQYMKTKFEDFLKKFWRNYLSSESSLIQKHRVCFPSLRSKENRLRHVHLGGFLCTLPFATWRHIGFHAFFAETRFLPRCRSIKSRSARALLEENRLRREHLGSAARPFWWPARAQSHRCTPPFLLE